MNLKSGSKNSVFFLCFFSVLACVFMAACKNKESVKKGRETPVTHKTSASEEAYASTQNTPFSGLSTTTTSTTHGTAYYTAHNTGGAGVVAGDIPVEIRGSFEDYS